MRDVFLDDTFYYGFTTRSFTTGAPTTLLGTPILSVLEENNNTPITAGVSLNVDRASVPGLNEATIVATSGNGYEIGKGYSIYVSTGIVDSVDVAGEIVGYFTINSLNISKISGSTIAADNLEAGVTGLVSTTVNDASAAPTSFAISSSEVTDNHFNGRIITFISGDLMFQSTDITDYDGASRTVTVTELTEAPANGDAFVIS